MKLIILIVIFLLIVVGLMAQANDRKNRKIQRAEKNLMIAAKVDSLTLSGNFTIMAHSAQPMGWQTIQLSSLYDLQIKGDSVEANLPYYGRAYAVDYASTDGGIKINSTTIDYKQLRKRNNWEITFETRTESDLYQFRISITTSGYATIFVTSNNRQGIGFNGELKGTR